MEIKGGWLTNFEDNYFAPCTLFSQVKDESDGTSLTDYILSTAIRFTGINTNITNIKNNITTIEGNITNILGLKFQTNLNKSELGSIVIGNTVVSGVTGVLPIANGGTGTSTLSANKLLYSNSSQIITSKHYIDNDKIQVNVDSLVEDHNFYVNGNSLFDGQVNIKGDLSIKNNDYSSHILFSPQSLNTLAGKINYNTRQEFAPGEISNISRFEFNQYSHDSYNENTLLETYDCYFLPSTPNDKGTNDYYEIITSKGGSSINGNMTFNGQTTFNEYTFFTSRFVINNSENGSTLRFGSSKTSNNEADLRARIRYMFKKSASDSLVNRSQLIFEQNSYDSTTGAKLSYADSFRLPETAADKAGNNTYDIITSKGGIISGDLTISGALNLPDAGLIRIKSDNDAALNAFGSIAIGKDKDQQIRIDDNEIISVKYDSGTSAYVSSTLHLNGIAGGSVSVGTGESGTVNIGTGKNGTVSIGTGAGGKTKIGSIESTLVPSATAQYNLGASATRWNSAFISSYCYCGALIVGRNDINGATANGYGTKTPNSDVGSPKVGRIYFRVID